jgi:hypothetical protein
MCLRLLCFKILVHLGNLVILRSNYDIPFTPGLTDAILNFAGEAWNFSKLETWQIIACDSLPIGENRMHKSPIWPNIHVGGFSFCTPAVHGTKTSRCSSVTKKNYHEGMKVCGEMCGRSIIIGTTHRSLSWGWHTQLLIEGPDSFAVIVRIKSRLLCWKLKSTQLTISGMRILYLNLSFHKVISIRTYSVWSTQFEKFYDGHSFQIFNWKIIHSRLISSFGYFSLNLSGFHSHWFFCYICYQVELLNTLLSAEPNQNWYAPVE